MTVRFDEMLWYDPAAQVLQVIRAHVATTPAGDETTWELPAVQGDPWYWAATPTQPLPVCRPWPSDRRTQ